jgi:hypothetical protein
MNARDALHMDHITRDEMRALIRRTFDFFAPNDPMRDVLIGMTNTLPLFWVIHHFLNEVRHREWNLAIVFAENPALFMQCLEAGDMLPYLAEYPERGVL